MYTHTHTHMEIVFMVYKISQRCHKVIFKNIKERKGETKSYIITREANIF